jgi:hypothetical protein
MLCQMHGRTYGNLQPYSVCISLDGPDLKAPQQMQNLAALTCCWMRVSMVDSGILFRVERVGASVPGHQ